MSIGRKLCATGFATVSAAVLLAVGTATPASAGIDECTVFYGWTTCSTDSIAANPNTGSVTVRTFESYIANPICDPSEIRWKLVDSTNGKVVRRGSGAGTWTVTGLTNRYYGRLDTCPRMSIEVSS
ncbi:hypothetical protein [Planomonospora venezuelensis]|uniref:Secreted protein n=1 Tax=Planomonospora venezuelensis TaxID=1999 RepID=A0A841D6A6_PLAVE|nr:hypothetical protein [Planomonospora venezuelensis]MBB5964034.1 hypothetical protein [Planomonospora venezuelensis]GIM99656.1 hypothetical protein Pve01_13150 [Planomonospora venezuelensis]